MRFYAYLSLLEEEEEKGLVVQGHGSTEWYYKNIRDLAQIQDPSKIKKYKFEGLNL